MVIDINKITETEQTFYKVFGINPIRTLHECDTVTGMCELPDNINCSDCGSKIENKMPAKITAQNREDLIKIIIEKYGDFTYSKFHNPIENLTTYQAMCSFEWEEWNNTSDDAESIKEALLKLCIKLSNEIKPQVQKLFK